MSFLGQGPECHSHTSCCDWDALICLPILGKDLWFLMWPQPEVLPQIPSLHLIPGSRPNSGTNFPESFRLSFYHLPQPKPIHPEHAVTVTQMLTRAWVSQIPISRGHKTYLWNHTPYSLTLAVVSWVLALEMYCSIHFFAFGKFSICYFPKTHTYS